uniref:ciliary neurotrophic factor receptor subunit alpha-like isoform X1 n=2 Tax=Myxine glutinosa TaxID=7769 RepID=UPI00358FDC51
MPPNPKGSKSEAASSKETMLAWRLRILLATLAASVSLANAICAKSELSKPGVQAAAIGSDVQLVCNKMEENIHWTLNGQALPSSLVFVAQDGHLNLTKINLEANGTYRCNTHSRVSLHSITLLVGYQPSPPTINCRTSNTVEFGCDWTPGKESHLPTKYSLVIHTVSSVGSMEDDIVPCIQKGTQGPYRCIFDSYIRSLITLRVKMTARNVLGCTESNGESFIPREILKPDPPVIVNATSVDQEPTKLFVEWRNPSSWVDMFGHLLQYELRFRSLRHIDFENERFSKNKRKYVIPNAEPFTLHVVQVRARESYHYGKWSEWSPVTYVAPWNDTRIKNVFVQEDWSVAPTQGKGVNTTGLEINQTWFLQALNDSHPKIFNEFVIYTVVGVVGIAVCISMAVLVVMQRKKKFNKSTKAIIHVPSPQTPPDVVFFPRDPRQSPVENMTLMNWEYFAQSHTANALAALERGD